jgi:hypothetical protein
MTYRDSAACAVTRLVSLAWMLAKAVVGSGKEVATRG